MRRARDGGSKLTSLKVQRTCASQSNQGAFQFFQFINLNPNWQRQSHNDHWESEIKTHATQTVEPRAIVRHVSQFLIPNGCSVIGVTNLCSNHSSTHRQHDKKFNEKFKLIGVGFQPRGIHSIAELLLCITNEVRPPRAMGRTLAADP